jgi:hypothetical protein
MPKSSSINNLFSISSCKSIPGLTILEFKSYSSMEQYLGDFATAQEGFVPHRVGHNLKMDTLHSFIKKNHPSSFHRILYNSIIEKFPSTLFIIAFKSGDELTRRHEFQHAKFFFSNSFREQVYDLWFRILSDKTRQKYISFLLSAGYPNEPNILIDEFQAYYFTGEIYFKNR